jgi:rfaE bifunctional protein kinase chain/domain
MALAALFESFKEKHIVVLGDVMIDAYLEGVVNRVSPEAPVPIVNFTKREERLGGAANVALNLLSLGAKVSMASVIGKDEDAKTLLALMQEKGINTNAVIQQEDRKTTVKTRVIGNNQQLLRVDKEQVDDIDQAGAQHLIEAIEQRFTEGCDAIIFEDYNKGVLTEMLIEKVIELAQKHDVLTTVDPKLNNFLSYKGVSLFKPNLKELSEGIKRTVNVEDKHEFENAVNDLNGMLNADHIFVTLSEHGVFIVSKNEKHYVPAHRRMITDVSGAGDTVISVATLCLAAGMSAKTIAEMANLAGGIVCEELGVVAIDAERLYNEAVKMQIQC